MLMSRFAITIALLAIATSASANITFDMLYTSGHGDIAFAVENGEFEAGYHVEGPEGAVIGGTLVFDEEFEADELAVAVSDMNLVSNFPTVSDVADFVGVRNALGLNAGDDFYNLLQDEVLADQAQAPYIGWGFEEIDLGFFVGDTVDVSVLNVVGGEFVVWGAGGIIFGGGDTTETFDVGGHTHYNIAFSGPGIFEVTLEATGMLVSGGTETATGVYTFVVGDAAIAAVPEPSSIALIGLGGAALAIAFRKRKNG